MRTDKEGTRARRIADGPAFVPSDRHGGDGRRIGAALRRARQQQKLSLEQLAQMTSLTKGFISLLERDMTSASVASLVKICDALHVNVGSLFQSPQAHLCRKTDARPINFGGIALVEHLLTPRESSLQMIRSEIGPGGGSGSESYSLNADAEVVHVLEGRLVVSVEDGDYELGAGDTLSFSPRQAHAFHNPSRDKRAIVVWALSPSPW